MGYVYIMCALYGHTYTTLYTNHIHYTQAEEDSTNSCARAL